MSFSLRLATDLLPVDAGATTPYAIEIANRSDGPDRFEVSVEGLDPDWTAIPVGVVDVDAHDVVTEKVFFKPPRSSESAAGNYPFVVKIRSLQSGEARTTQGVLQVRPFHHLSIDATPKRGTVSPVRKEENFQLTLMNLGNTEHVLKIAGNDPGDICAFDFAEHEVTLAPGQQKVVDASVTARSYPIIGGARLHGITFSARSVSVTNMAAATQVQLEQRALLSPASLAAFILFLILATGWWLLLPKPPMIEVLTLDTNKVNRGDPILVSWRAVNAKSVRITFGNDPPIEATSLIGSREFRPTESGTVVAVAMSDGKRSEEVLRTYTVVVPEPGPKPEILDFSVNPKKVKVGETFVVSYRFNDAVKRAILEPVHEELNIAVNQREVRASRPGDLTYTLVAFNAGGEIVQKTVTITVEDSTLPSIVVFSARPNPISYEDGRVSLTWQLYNAIRAEISDGLNVFEVSADSGTQEFLLGTTTTYTITAYDIQGRTVTKSLKVVVADPQRGGVPTGPPSTGGGGAGTAGGIGPGSGGGR